MKNSKVIMNTFELTENLYRYIISVKTHEGKHGRQSSKTRGKKDVEFKYSGRIIQHVCQDLYRCRDNENGRYREVLPLFAAAESTSTRTVR